MALCRESWLDWKDDPAQMARLAESLRSAFGQKPDGTLEPIGREVLVVGLPVRQAFPESVGMGVGFSVLVGAPFEETRGRVERTIGRLLGKCETGDGMRTCALEIAEKRTLMLMAPDGSNGGETLVGCYYYYEK